MEKVKEKIEYNPEAIGKIANKYKLKLIIVFGSFANGKTHEESDLDVGVLCEDDITFRREVRLDGELAKAFGRDVDLTILNRANPLLAFLASKNPLLVFGQTQELFKFKLRAFKAYHDYAPYFEMERRLNKKIINAYGSR